MCMGWGCGEGMGARAEAALGGEEGAESTRRVFHEAHGNVRRATIEGSIH